MDEFDDLMLLTTVMSMNDGVLRRRDHPRVADDVRSVGACWVTGAGASRYVRRCDLRQQPSDAVRGRAGDVSRCGALDVLFEDAGLVIEFDGYEVHSKPEVSSRIGKR